MKITEGSKIITGVENFTERVDEITSQVSYEKVKHTISELKKALYNNSSLPALCAPQIGIPLRLFVVKQAKAETDRFKVFLNPMIVTAEGLHLSREVSASVPEKEFIIPRRNKIHVAYQSEDGHVLSDTYLGAYAEVIQQMIEMLDGITLADYGLDLDDVGGPEAFTKAPKKQQAEVLALYLDTLKGISADLSAEINADPHLTELNSYIDELADVLSKDKLEIDKLKEATAE